MAPRFLVFTFHLPPPSYRLFFRQHFLFFLLLIISFVSRPGWLG